MMLWALFRALWAFWLRGRCVWCVYVLSLPGIPMGAVLGPPGGATWEGTNEHLKLGPD